MDDGDLFEPAVTMETEQEGCDLKGFSLTLTHPYIRTHNHVHICSHNIQSMYILEAISYCYDIVASSHT